MVDGNYSAVRDLVTLVPPPAEPVDAQGDWRSVEVSLGTVLPADYKALIERYGLGMFVDFILLHTPFGPGPRCYSEPGTCQRSCAGAPDQWLERFPYRVYPQPGGLLEWAPGYRSGGAGRRHGADRRGTGGG